MITVHLVLLFACTTPSKEVQTGDIRILTYNVHGLPSEITGDDTTSRIEQIATILSTSDYDIIGMQEEWIDSDHEILVENSGYSYVDRFDEKLDASKVYGAGLATWSDLPITNSTHFFYPSCYGYIENASDCFASKGLQMTEIALSETISETSTLHFYNTHLEAGNGTEDSDIRGEEIAQIISIINEHSADHPVVFVGDFNLSFSDSVDNAQLQSLMQDANLTHACMAVDCPEADHIDQIFLRSSSEISLSVESWSRESQFVDADNVDLSDHPAISADLHWETKE